MGLAGLRRLAPLWVSPPIPSTLAVSCFGLTFTHPLGLAAGFDKNGDYIDALGALGFSHIELGTVTPRPQSGNPKPRMFRPPGGALLVNRMGFNNKGVDHLVGRLERARYRGIRGISIGKNADTPIDRAAEDYLACLRKVYAHADYIAVNVSSPNTARLRELQDPDGLQRILGSLLDERAALSSDHAKQVPLLVKIAPDLADADIDAVADLALDLGLDGIIATNTTISRAGLRDSAAVADAGPGGLSGAPLKARALAVLERFHARAGDRLVLIAAGGIETADDARDRLAAGATLLQAYTAFIYEGPCWPGRVQRGLAARIRAAQPV